MAAEGNAVQGGPVAEHTAVGIDSKRAADGEPKGFTFWNERRHFLLVTYLRTGDLEVAHEDAAPSFEKVNVRLWEQLLMMWRPAFVDDALVMELGVAALAEKPTTSSERLVSYDGSVLTIKLNMRHCLVIRAKVLPVMTVFRIGWRLKNWHMPNAFSGGGFYGVYVMFRARSRSLARRGAEN